MAHYWVGGTDNWDATAGNKWATASGGTTYQSNPPTATDDVYIDANSGAVTITINTNVACKNFICTGFTGTLVQTTSTYALDIYGDTCTFVAGMTYTTDNNNLLRFGGSGVTCALTSAGKTLPDTRIGATTSNTTVSLQDALSCYFLRHAGGTFTTNDYSVTISESTGWDPTGNYTKTFNLGSSTITLSTGLLDFDTARSYITLNTGTSHIQFTGSGYCHIYPGSLTFYDFTMTNVGWTTLANYFGTSGRGGTFHNISIAQTTKYAYVSVQGDIVCNDFGFNGYSEKHILYLLGDTVGTRTITCNGTVSMTYAMIRRITGAGSASWDLSAVTTVSDASENSGITFATGIDCYWVHPSVSNAYWSDSANWRTASGGGTVARTPLLQDNVVFDGSSFVSSSYRTVSVDTRVMCRNMTWTGVSYTPGLVGLATYGTYITGSITMVSSMTYTNNGSWNLINSGRNITIDSGGKTLGGMVIDCGNTNTGTLAANLTCGNFTIAGNFLTGNYNLNCAGMSIATASGASITWGSSTITITAGFNSSGVTGITWNYDTSSFICSPTANQQYYMYLVGPATLSFYNLKFYATSAITLSFTSKVRVYNNFEISGSDFTFKFWASSTHTTVLDGNVTLTGSSGHSIIVTTNIAGTRCYITKPSGTVTASYFNLKDTDVSGGATFNADATCTDSGNNTGWNFLTANNSNMFLMW